ncbi:transposase [Marivirga aurantiaca]|uniref:transposase n=1 Tax=Marivirga aurantiaca TaxID=2802615 RepID=UPI001F24995C|nr:transposase [Marivirga aurantiaca]
MNGKETPQGSFMKFTAHQFRKRVMNSGNWKLSSFISNAANKEHEFWQRDSLAIHLYSPEVILQKMEYIHNTPIVKGWNLAHEPVAYKYSSAEFYERGVRNFTFLKDIREEF